MVESAVLDCGFLGADPRALSFCSDFPRPERSFNVAPLQGRLDQVDTSQLVQCSPMVLFWELSEVERQVSRSVFTRR